MDKSRKRRPLVDYLLPDERRDIDWKSKSKNSKSGKPVKKYNDGPKTGLAQGAKNYNKSKILQTSQFKESALNNKRNNVEARDISKQKYLLRPSKSLTNILDESNNNDEEIGIPNYYNNRKSSEVNQFNQFKNVLKSNKSSMNILLDDCEYEGQETEASTNINDRRCVEASQSTKRKNVLRSAKDLMSMLHDSETIESTDTNEKNSLETYQSKPPKIMLRPATSLMDMLGEYEIQESNNINKRKSLETYRPVQTNSVLRPASSLMNMLYEPEITESKNINVRRSLEAYRSIPAKIVLRPAEHSMNMFQECETLESDKRRSLNAHRLIPTKNLKPTNCLVIESETPETNHNTYKETLQDNQLNTIEPEKRLLLDDSYNYRVKEPQTNDLTNKSILLQKNLSQHIPLQEKSTMSTLDETLHEVNKIQESPSVFKTEISSSIQNEQINLRPLPAKRFINTLSTSNYDVKDTQESNKFNNSLNVLNAKPTAKPTTKPVAIPRGKPRAKPLAKPTTKPAAILRGKPTLAAKPIAHPTTQPIPAKRMNIPNKSIYGAQEPNKTVKFSQRNVPANRTILNESKYEMNKTKEANNLIKPKNIEKVSDILNDTKGFDIVEEANCLENKILETKQTRKVDPLQEVKLTRQINVSESAKLTLNISDEFKRELRETHDANNINQRVTLEASQSKIKNSLEQEEKSTSKALDEAFGKVVDTKESSNFESRIKIEQVNAPISSQTNVLIPAKEIFDKSGEEEDGFIVTQSDFQVGQSTNPISKQMNVLRAAKSFIYLIDGKEYEANNSFVHATNSLTRYQSVFNKKRKDVEACDKLFQLHEQVFVKIYEKKPIVLHLGKNVIKERHLPLKLQDQSENRQNISDTIERFNNIQEVDKSQNKNHTDEEKIKEYFSSWNHKIKNTNPRATIYTHNDLNKHASVPMIRAKSESELLDAVDVVNSTFSRKSLLFEGGILSKAVSMESIAGSFRIPRVSNYNRSSFGSVNILSDERNSSTDDSPWWISSEDSLKVSQDRLPSYPAIIPRVRSYRPPQRDEEVGPMAAGPGGAVQFPNVKDKMKLLEQSGHLVGSPKSRYMMGATDGLPTRVLPQPSFRDVEIRSKESNRLLQEQRSKSMQTTSAPRRLDNINLGGPSRGGEVFKEGHLEWTKFADNGKKVRKNWQNNWAILKRSTLEFYSHNYPKQKSDPEFVFPLDDPVVTDATLQQTKQSHAYMLTSKRDQILLRHKDQAEASEWKNRIMNTINQQATDYQCPDTSSLSQASSTGTPSPSPKHKHSKTKGFPKDSDKSDAQYAKNDVSENYVKTDVENVSDISDPQEMQSSFKKTKFTIQNLMRKRKTREQITKDGIYKDEAVFGCSLQDVCNKDKSDVPEFVKHCIRVIESKEEHMNTDGLYRASGNLSQVQKIRMEVDKNNFKILDKPDTDVHVLAGALKLFFRELKEPVIPCDLFQKTLNATSIQDYHGRVKELKDVVDNLPKCNRITLQFLLEHLLRVTQREDKNRMHIANLSIVLGPTLLWPSPEKMNQISMGFLQQNLAIEIMLTEFKTIFNTGDYQTPL